MADNQFLGRIEGGGTRAEGLQVGIRKQRDVGEKMENHEMARWSESSTDRSTIGKQLGKCSWETANLV